MIKKKKDVPFLGRHEWILMLIWPLLFIYGYWSMRKRNISEFRRWGIDESVNTGILPLICAIAVLVVLVVAITVIIVLVFDPIWSFFYCSSETFILKCLAGSGI